MKDKKVLVMGIAFLAVFMVLTAFPVKGLTASDFNFSGVDASGDAGNPDVDIISAKVTSDGSDVIFTMKVSGKIVTDNESYTYGFSVIDTDSNNMVTLAYSNGAASYFSNSASSSTTYNVSGNLLTLKAPLSLFSSFSSSLTITAVADDSNDHRDMLILAQSSGSSSGGSGGSTGGSEEHEEKCPDPTTERPTDTSIQVKITEVKISFEKTNGGQSMHSVIIVKGTTSGVDHVSLNIVWYYKNGSHDWGWSWMRGPLNPPMNPPGVSKMYFKSTSGNWNTWELNIDMTQPVQNMKGNYSGAIYMSNISKVRIYARAYADANETQWNQDYYEFTPSISASSDSMSYDSTQGSGTAGGEDNGGGDNSGSSGEGSSGGNSPGFEAFAAIGALSVAGILYSRRRK